MNKKLTLIFTCVCFTFASVGVVHAKSLTANQSSVISTSCSSIKSSLKSIQHLDSRTRSYYGKYYETILTDYMIPLGTRLMRANQPDAKLTEIQSEFTSARAQFNSDFISYSQSFEDLTSTDCVAHPEDFYAKLETVRQKRTILAKDIESVQQVVDRYRASVGKLQESYGK